VKKLFSFAVTFLGILHVCGQVSPESERGKLTYSVAGSDIKSGHKYLQIVYEHGGILPLDDNPKVNELLRSSSFNGISVRYGWEIRPSSVYHSVYRRPIMGLGMMATTFNNPVIGAPISVFGFVEIPFSREISRWNFSYGLALGISFNFNPYDNVRNPENLMISSNYNAYLHANIQGKYQVNKNLQLGLGIGYKHFSNGSTKKPNAGINLAPLQVSAQYKIDNTPGSKLDKLPPFKSFWSFSLYTSSGMKQNNPGEELIYKNLTGMFLAYQFSYKYKMGLGFDLNYSSGGTRRVANASAFSSNFSYGIYTGWEWYLTERLYIPISLGLYLHHNPENSETTLMYERIGVRYLFFNRHFSMGPGLKAHAGTADFIEFNLGWVFHRDRNTYRNN
jgi:hypothetical protein